jgi:hypothetical protein
MPSFATSLNKKAFQLLEYLHLHIEIEQFFMPLAARNARKE